MSKFQMVTVSLDWVNDVKKYVNDTNRFLWWMRIWIPAVAVGGVVLGLISGWLLWGAP